MLKPTATRGFLAQHSQDSANLRACGYGGIAYRHVTNTYIALFSRFIPCGVWEAVYIIEGLMRNTSEVQPDTIHADTQGQALPVFGLGALLAFDLLPRIRNWHDLTFYRPDGTPDTPTSTRCSATTRSTGT
jgi:TnpA family transposase